MLEIKHLSYRVEDESGTADILRDVSLTIDDKRFVVITGPNGGGKTSLARTVMGINPVTSGSIFWNGKDITALSVTERARLGISYGFQQPPRFKGMKVRDLLNIAAGAPMSPATISTATWMPAFPAARSSASRSRRCWRAAAAS